MLKNFLIAIFLTMFSQWGHSQTYVDCYENVMINKRTNQLTPAGDEQFSGLIIKIGNRRRKLYSPVKVKLVSSRLFNLEDAYGNKAQIDVNSVVTYNTKDALLQYFEGCSSTSYTETDPVFAASPAANLTQAQIDSIGMSGGVDTIPRFYIDLISYYDNNEAVDVGYRIDFPPGITATFDSFIPGSNPDVNTSNLYFPDFGIIRATLNWGTSTFKGTSWSGQMRFNLSDGSIYDTPIIFINPPIRYRAQWNQENSNVPSYIVGKPNIGIGSNNLRDSSSLFVGPLNLMKIDTAGLTEFQIDDEGLLIYDPNLQKPMMNIGGIWRTIGDIYGDGETSVAIGQGASSTMLSGIAIGTSASSESAGAVAIGSGSESLGSFDIAIGNNASAENGIAIGTNASAEGNASIAIGDGGTTADCQNCVVLGYNTNSTAGADHSFNLGSNRPLAKGGAYQIGRYAEAMAGYEIAIGQWNESYTANSNGLWNTNDKLFDIGNGANLFGRSSAFSVYKNGALMIHPMDPTTIGTPREGMLIYNQTSDAFEAYDGTQWNSLQSSGGGASTSIEKLSANVNAFTTFVDLFTINCPTAGTYEVKVRVRASTSNDNIGPRLAIRTQNGLVGELVGTALTYGFGTNDLIVLNNLPTNYSDSSSENSISSIECTNAVANFNIPFNMDFVVEVTTPGDVQVGIKARASGATITALEHSYAKVTQF